MGCHIAAARREGCGGEEGWGVRDNTRGEAPSKRKSGEEVPFSSAFLSVWGMLSPSVCGRRAVSCFLFLSVLFVDRDDIGPREGVCLFVCLSVVSIDDVVCRVMAWHGVVRRRLRERRRPCVGSVRAWGRRVDLRSIRGAWSRPRSPRRAARLGSRRRRGRRTRGL